MKKKPPPPIEFQTKPLLTTAEAAHYLNRTEQTLRGWACRSGNPPIDPVRISGRLGWKTSEVRKIVGVRAALQDESLKG